MSSTDIVDRLSSIEALLKDVVQRMSDIEGIVAVTRDGLPVASALHTPIDEDRIAAMTAASLSLSERVSMELERGEMQQIIIHGSDGIIVIMDAGEHVVLASIARKGAKLGLVLLDMKRCAESLSKLI